ncbi:MAG TPA: hypothetical protein VGC45_09620 [Gryllotalpicola sp.]
MSSRLAVVVARLQEHRVPFETIEVGPGAVILVSAYGGRVYGPFFDGGVAENWLPDAFASPSDFAALVSSGFWNVGGDRMWIGPEIAYMIPERSDYWGSYTMPADIDPGENTLSRDSAGVSVRRGIRARSFVSPGSVALDLTTTVRAAASPLRNLRSGLDPSAVSYGGYTVTARLEVADDSDSGLEVESWMLNQVRPGGTAIVPGTRVQVTDYYEPVGALLAERGGHVAVSLTGAQRFKIGFSAPTVFGRMGYLRDDPDGAAVLVVRNSLSDASAEYAEEPDFAVGRRGDSLHLYNDDGGLGGFAELEARGLPIRSGTPGTSSTTDRFTSWWFRGEASAVRDIAAVLLGAGAQEHHRPERPPGKKDAS